jgi:hypothetical protein
MDNTQYLFGWELTPDNVTSQEGNKHNDFSLIKSTHKNNLRI